MTTSVSSVKFILLTCLLAALLAGAQIDFASLLLSDAPEEKVAPPKPPKNELQLSTKKSKNDQWEFLKKLLLVKEDDNGVKVVEKKIEKTVASKDDSPLLGGDDLKDSSGITPTTALPKLKDCTGFLERLADLLRLIATGISECESVDSSETFLSGLTFVSESGPFTDDDFLFAADYSDDETNGSEALTKSDSEELPKNETKVKPEEESDKTDSLSDVDDEDFESETEEEDEIGDTESLKNVRAKTEAESDLAKKVDLHPLSAEDKLTLASLLKKLQNKAATDVAVE